MGNKRLAFVGASNENNSKDWGIVQGLMNYLYKNNEKFSSFEKNNNIKSARKQLSLIGLDKFADNDTRLVKELNNQAVVVVNGAETMEKIRSLEGLAINPLYFNDLLKENEYDHNQTYEKIISKYYENASKKEY